MKQLRILEDGSKRMGDRKKGKSGHTKDKLSHSKKMNEGILRKEKELQAFKSLLAQREMEIRQLRDEINYKNQQLASKDIEMETYKNLTEEKIFKLEAKIKELEAKIKRQK